MIPDALRQDLQHIGRLAVNHQCEAFAVGGCVRDWFLGVDSPDIDIAIEGDGLSFAKQLQRILGGELVQHAQFGTATLVTPGLGIKQLDVVTCRREAYERPAAYPRVERGTISDDLFRRDFTLNAMAVAIRPERFGLLVDPFEGQADLEARQLRILHAQSFIDDPSRILRGIRFLHRFDLQWEPQTKQRLIQALRSGALNALNPGRVEKEFERMTAEPRPAACFQALEALLAESTA
jgi:tRNA nucleotidyltransferase (CCA-adding enzyme)